MPLVSLLKRLPQMRQEGYAVVLFPAFDMYGAEGMIRAAEALQAPVIIGMYSKILGESYARGFAEFVRMRAQESPVPVSLMVDHGTEVEDCIRAIALGFSDIMFDGSSLAFEENIAQTRAVVQAAKAVGIPVEAELGHVGSGDSVDRSGFTDPDTVARFAAETGVDALAVAIGNGHGLYRGVPHIELGLLADIRSRLDTPLVLHGGTGLSEEQFHSAIQRGVAKINIGTDLFVTTAKRVTERGAKGDMSFFDINRTILDTFTERCKYYIELFGGAGKSWTSAGRA